MISVKLNTRSTWQWCHFKIMGSKVKIANNISPKIHFYGEGTLRLTVHHRKPSSFLCFALSTSTVLAGRQKTHRDDFSTVLGRRTLLNIVKDRDIIEVKAQLPHRTATDMHPAWQSITPDIPFSVTQTLVLVATWEPKLLYGKVR